MKAMEAFHLASDNANYNTRVTTACPMSNSIFGHVTNIDGDMVWYLCPYVNMLN